MPPLGFGRYISSRWSRSVRVAEAGDVALDFLFDSLADQSLWPHAGEIALGGEVLFAMNKLIRLIAVVSAIAAIACAIVLLASDTKAPIPQSISPAAISAAPLLLIGASLLIFQATQRARAVEALKNVLLAAAFLLWGAVQLMKPSTVSQSLGHVVIVLYVLDLAWVILARANARPPRPQ
jgi:peptidoglycan/LPS O-acetylase OafA/YrhL